MPTILLRYVQIEHYFRYICRVKCYNIFKNVIKLKTKHWDRRHSFEKNRVWNSKQRLNLLLFYITFLCKYYYFSKQRYITDELSYELTFNFHWNLILYHDVITKIPEVLKTFFSEYLSRQVKQKGGENKIDCRISSFNRGPLIQS